MLPASLDHIFVLFDAEDALSCKKFKPFPFLLTARFLPKFMQKEAYDRTSLQKMVRSRKIFPLPSLGIGFGDLKKTAENLPPGVPIKEPDSAELILKTASGRCSQLLDRICCMCFIQSCSQLSDQCVITLSQLCAALSCFECLNCCYDLCVNCG